MLSENFSKTCLLDVSEMKKDSESNTESKLRALLKLTYVFKYSSSQTMFIRIKLLAPICDARPHPSHNWQWQGLLLQTNEMIWIFMVSHLLQINQSGTSFRNRRSLFPKPTHNRDLGISSMYYCNISPMSIIEIWKAIKTIPFNSDFWWEFLHKYAVCVPFSISELLPP